MVKVDPQLGKTVLDIVYRIGGFNQKEWIARKFEGKISKQLSTILKTFTESHHKTLSLAVDEARGQFMKDDGKGNKVVDAEKIKALLKPKKAKTAEEKKAEDEVTQKTFDLGVHNIALLARDTLYRVICKSATNFFKKGVNGTVAKNLPAASEIERVIHTVYRKMFGDPLFNTNLTLNIVDIVRRHFKEAAKRVHEMRAPAPAKVEVV